MRDGWKAVRLGELCSVDKRKYQGSNLPFVGLEDIESGTGRFVGSLDPKSVGSSTIRFTSHHLLYGRLRPYLNKVLRPDFEGHCSSEIFPILASNELDRSFLYYWITSQPVVEKIDKTSTGARMPRANVSAILNFDCFLPPLPEQKRIVAILDEAFEGIAAAVANAEKNLANARELFDGYLESLFVNGGSDWTKTTLGEVANFKNGLNFTKSSKGEKIKIVGVADFQNNLWVPTDELNTVQIDAKLSDAYLLQEGDILTVRSNGNKQLIGRCLLAGPVSERTSHSGFTIRIRVSSKELSPEYLVQHLKSGQSRRQLIESGDGANINSLNQQALSTLPISFPSLADQAAIVERLNGIGVDSAALGEVYRKKLTALAELKQSLLQKAFSGELTAQPDKELAEAVA